MVEEHETYKQRESEKYETLESRLRKTQELLRDTTKEFLNERKSQREKERDWLQDRDKLMHRLDKAHDKIGIYFVLSLKSEIKAAYIEYILKTDINQSEVLN